MKNNLGITCNIYILYIKIYMLIEIDLGELVTGHVKGICYTKQVELIILSINWGILTGE